MPPETTLEPPTATPSPTMDAFDATFSDLDSAPAAPTPTPNEPTRTTQPQDPATGKFTKAEPGVPEGGTESKPALPVEPRGTKGPVEPKDVGDDAKKADPVSKATEFEPPQVAKPSELRAYAKKMGGRAQVAEQQVSQLNSRLKALESRAQPSGDTKALTEELAGTKKQLEAAYAELKVVRYESHPDYKDKYEKPYQNAVTNAWTEVQELLVTVPNPNDPDNPTERLATAQDFDEVYNLPLGQAAKLARQKFGESASIVMQHVKAVKDAKKAALGAIDEHKGNAAEFEKQQSVQQQMEREGRDLAFNEAFQSIVDKYKDLFSPRDGEPAWNENLAKGKHFASLAFGKRESMTPLQSIALDAQINARLMAFPALKGERDTFKAQLAEAQKEIAELRGSSPGKTAPGAAKSEGADMTLDQAFDKFVT